jgi:hypothetical protein
MTTALQMEGYGVAATLPLEWDGRIVQPDGGVVCLHAASFALLPFDGEWPGAIVMTMPPGGAVLALIEQDPAYAGAGAFLADAVPQNIGTSDFGPGVMPSPTNGRWGAQFTFTVPSTRTWVCWIVVDRTAGDDDARLSDLNSLLASLSIDSANRG